MILLAPRAHWCFSRHQTVGYYADSLEAEEQGGYSIGLELKPDFTYDALYLREEEEDQEFQGTTTPLFSIWLVYHFLVD